MITRLLSVISLSLILCLPALAQSDSLRGTWSGHWAPEAGARDAVTVRFALEDDSFSGELVNPESLEFDTVSFDSETGSVVAEAEGEHGRFRIEARIEEDTRLNGTLTHDNTSGEMRLTKWTYVPRIR